MAGILMGLCLSWLLLWLYKRKGLAVLGLGITRRRLYQFLFGFVAASACCALYFIAQVWLSHSSIQVNNGYGGWSFLQGGWWVFRSVFFEEIVYRGALLYIAIQLLGTRAGCLLSALAFGIYHWFSYGVWGQPVPMLYVLLITGIAGYVFAYAYALTKSLYLPTGLHLGWNLLMIVVFSQGPAGDQWLRISEGEQIPGVWSIVLFLFQLAVYPLILWGFARTRKLPLPAGAG